MRSKIAIMIAVVVCQSQTSLAQTFLLEWSASSFEHITGFDISPTDEIYVTGALCDCVQKFSTTGILLNEWTVAAAPSDVAVGPDGSVFIGLSVADRVDRFTADGVFMNSIGSSGNGDGQFAGIGPVAVNSSGDVYIYDGNNKRMQIMTSTGGFLAKWGSEGTGPDEFLIVLDMAIGPSGDVYVVNAGSGIQRFDSAGNFISNWFSIDPGGFAKGAGVGSDGRVYGAFATDPPTAIPLQVFSESGVLLHSFGTPGTTGGTLDFALDVALDSMGNIYVLDFDRAELLKFSALGPVAIEASSWSSIKNKYKAHIK